MGEKLLKRLKRILNLEYYLFPPVIRTQFAKIYCPTQAIKDYVEIYSRGLHVETALADSFYRSVVRTHLILQKGKEPTAEDIDNDIRNHKPIFYGCNTITSLYPTTKIIIPSVAYISSLLGGKPRQRIIDDAIKITSDNTLVVVQKGRDKRHVYRWLLERDDLELVERNVFKVKKPFKRQKMFIGL